jgi:hypothetical protein
MALVLLAWPAFCQTVRAVSIWPAPSLGAVADAHRFVWCGAADCLQPQLVEDRAFLRRTQVAHPHHADSDTTKEQTRSRATPASPVNDVAMQVWPESF